MRQFHPEPELPDKFFLISQVFYPDEVSTASLFTNLCSYLSKRGVQVEVWAAQPSYTLSIKQPGKIIYEGIHIKYLPSTHFHKSNTPGRVLNILTFMISSVLKLLFAKDKSPVFTHTTPPSLGLIISIICILKKRKFVYIMLDIFPEGLIRLGKIKDRNIFVTLWKKSFINSLRRSHKIIVLGRDMLNYIQKISPESIDKIEYIPHWQDDSLIYPTAFEHNQFFKKLNLNGYFVVQYSGNMGLWNDMESIGRAISLKQEGVFYVMIGDGIRKKELQNIILSNNISNITFLPFQPTRNLSEVLTSCHVALVSLRKGMEGMAVPSKIYGILAAGIPVIALVPEESEISYIIKEEKCGIVVNPDDHEGMNNAIKKLKSDILLRQKLGKNGRLAFESKYTTKVITEKYLALIKELNNC